MNVVEIWAALNAGEIMTNGEVELSYKEDILHGADIIPFNADNAEEWYIKVPAPEPKTLYYRAVYDNDDMMKFSEAFYKQSHEMATGWRLFGEGYTKEQLLEG